MPIKTPSSGNNIRVGVLMSSLTIGGAEQLLIQLLENIDRDPFQVRAYFLRDPGPLGKEIQALGIPVKANLVGKYPDLKSIPGIARLLAGDKIDVLLLINHRNSLFYGILAAKLAGVRATINWQNETFRAYSYHWLTMLARRILLGGVSKVVAAAMGHAEYIASFEGVPREKIEVIYNAVNPRGMCSPLTRAQAREKLGIPVDGIAITMIAVMRPDKAHDVFLKAAAILLKKYPEAHFIMPGDGPQKEPLVRLAVSLGISNNVHFLGFRRDVADILRATDINVLSTKPEQETLSVAVIEAMAAGIPCVVTDVGFMKEIVIPGKTGFLVKVGDVEDLAEKVSLLYERPDLRKSMGRQAQALVDEKLNIGQMVRAFEDLFIRLSRRNSCAA